MKYTVPAEHAGSRLDVALSSLDDTYSRSSFIKIIKEGGVSINDCVIREPAKKVMVQDRIEVRKPVINKYPKSLVKTIYEDSNVLVIDKPAGLLTHSKGGISKEETLTDILLPLIDDDGTNRPGIVHRLDRDTSGVMIVAKNALSKKFLQKQFSTRKVDKKYLAIVKGVVTENEARLEWPIARNPKKPSTFRVDSKGKPAITIIKVKQRYEGYSLLDIELLTGRTHQIRVHLEHLGHPIVGDKIYNKPSPHGMMLHAYSLRIDIPPAISKTFVVNQPVRFVKFIKKI